MKILLDTHILLWVISNDVKLPEKARIVFEMSFIEGLKNVEIAEKLGLSDSSVKQYKASALDFLREKLDPNLFSFLFLSL